MLSVEMARSSFSPEWWIATVLRGERADPGIPTESEQALIAQAAGDHGVETLLYQALCDELRRNGQLQAISEPILARLTPANRQHVAWDLLRQHDLGRTLDKLSDAGIPYLLIKGAGLAYTHYQHSYLRDRCDTDILYPDQEAFDRAWEILKSLDYDQVNTLSGEFVGYQHCCFRPLGRGLHQILDCHIKINDYEFYADAFGFTELFEQSVALPQLAPSARTLGPVHALLMACMHLVATRPLGNADRLIWLYDIHLLGQSFSEAQWNEFLDLAKGRDLCGSCAHSLQAAQRYFPVGFPDRVMTELEQRAEKEPFKPDQNMKRWQYYFQILKSVPGLRKKAQLLREHFLPSADYLMRKYHTSNRLVLPFLYIHRVLAGMKRYF